MQIKRLIKSNLIYIGIVCVLTIALLFIVVNPFSILSTPTVYITIPSDPVLNTVPSPNLDGSIELSWSIPDETQYFEIFRMRGFGWFYLESMYYSTTYVDNNVGDGYTYKYKVVAVNPLGKSPDSNVVTVDIRLRTLVLPSVPVLNSIASPDTDGSISLSWSTSQNVDNYELFRSVNGDAYSFFKTLISISTSFIEPDGSYSYKIRACNDDGYSAYSNIVSVIVDILILPSVPVLNLDEHLLDDDLIGLDWSISQNAVGYEVYRSENGGIYRLFKTLIYNSVWFDTSYGRYSYKVRAYNDDEYSDYSNVVSITIDYPLLPSVPVLNLIASPDIDGSISLSWSISQNVVNYKVYRSVSGGLFVLFKTSSFPFVSFTESNGSYSYKVQAYNDVGYSDYSNIVSVIVLIYVPSDTSVPSDIFEISPIYFLLIGGLSIGGILIYTKTKKIKNR